MTADEYAAAGIELDDTSTTGLLTADAALDFVLAYTSLKFDTSSVDDVTALPAAVKLFVLKFCDLTVTYNAGITSESLGGMSQSFGDSDLNDLLFGLLYSLLGKWAKSQVHITQAGRKWRYGR